MKIVLQRVKQASVRVDNKTVGEISRGFLLFVAVGGSDENKDADWLVDKILKLRLFPDTKKSDSFLERNIKDIRGSVLVVSQFTLFGNCHKGTRPSFSEAAGPKQAEKLYNYFVEKLREKNVQAETGIFGAEMEVGLINDGPVTLIIDSKE
ncbi:MAG: D-tyrosyl-tRNA(Tyr) deacylase [Candidatus Magasanikbacteria bacterium]|nr:D-tyrosyl-tRNA(Tyr) deacylase [Candidatus Magasanikbacteria bacterium]